MTKKSHFRAPFSCAPRLRVSCASSLLRAPCPSSCAACLSCAPCHLPCVSCLPSSYRGPLTCPCSQSVMEPKKKQRIMLTTYSYFIVIYL